MTLHGLAHYGLSGERGYLSQAEIDEITLPADFAEIENAAARLSGLVATGRIRHWLKDLPVPDMARFLDTASDAQISLAMVRYAFLVQAHVWGEPTPPEALPANLAAPFVALADRIGVPPVMNYADYILENWYRLDPAGPIALGNVMQVQQFAGGLDEEWFVQIHVAIEATAGRALELAVELVRASDAADADAVEAMLIEMEAVWENIIAIFDRMVEKCDPYIYYNRIRLYINGWKNNAAMPDGLIYEGVERFGGRPQEFRGPTGSQSSIVPTMDALFQVSHENDELRDLLVELHHYRPRRHRAFIEDLQAASHLRDFAVQQGQGLKDAFNACVEQVARFRTRHLEYAANYINKQASSGIGNDPDIGTGGTPFMKYLKKHRDANRAQTI
jgi:indoleamine 2,3-dioxygenase